MRYDANRNYVYPVLRPYSDDYPNRQFHATVGVSETAEGVVQIVADFAVDETGIRHQIDSGMAICGAMVYCRDTLYRQIFTGLEGQYRAATDIPATHLQGEVQVHPVVIVNKDVLLPTGSAHPEYGAEPASVRAWQPLATDETWYFAVNRNLISTKAIFNWQIDPDMPHGVFDIEHDVSQPYINIKANAESIERFTALPDSRVYKFPTVYMGALIDALAEIRSIDDESICHSDGWVTCIKDHLKTKNIDLGTSEEPRDSVFRAAQLLFENPYMDLILGAPQTQDVDAETEDED